MANLYKGESKKIAVIINDENGDPVDPEAAPIVRVRVFLLNQINGSLIQKYSTDVSDTAYKTATVDGDDHVVCILDSSDTESQKPGRIEVQVNIYSTDADYEDSERVYIQKGILCNLIKAR